MKVLALQTSRNGSKGVPGKNTFEIRGKPLFAHNLEYARDCIQIDCVMAVSDIPEVQDYCVNNGIDSVDLPEEYTQDGSSHHESMMYGLRCAEDCYQTQFDIVVILFGNTIGARTEDLASAIRMLKGEPEWDSIQSVSEFNMFTPFRAMRETEDGSLETIMPQSMISEMAQGNPNDRRSAGRVLFFNGSFWITRREALVNHKGQLPFPWLGKKIGSYYQPTIMEIDASWQIKLLESGMGFSNWPFRGES